MHFLKVYAFAIAALIVCSASKCSSQQANTSTPSDQLELPKLTYRGMTFAHEGYDGKTGYGGQTVGPSLDSLAKLNVNSISIVPYTFLKDPNRPDTFFIPRRKGMETDEAVSYSIAQAHDRGWSVLLKPQIWVGGGHWPGDIDFSSEKEWNTFFENYEKWILIHARLAQREKVEALCIGTELVQTTLKYPQKWREIIAKIRAIYSGKLTYAANWGEEFEGFQFWDALDAIGLNSYYPLSKNQDPSDQELLAGAEAWMKMANKHAIAAGKPLWLTEVGFRSAKRAWLNPHAAAGDREVSNACQERCFEAMLKASSHAPALDGMFVWKWPSYLGWGAKKSDWQDKKPGRTFTPGGKPAAALLQRYYHETAQ